MKMYEKLSPDYPRPQLVRESFLSLNGEWDFDLVSSFTSGMKLTTKIIVPFAVESHLSHVEKVVNKNQMMVYSKSVNYVKKENKRAILHFDGIDQEASVYINHVFVGSHKGGYLPFEIDITKQIEGNKFLVEVVAKDDTDLTLFSKGKQKNKRGGIFYTPTSGIYQDVWLEEVSLNYIKRFDFDIDYDKHEVKFDVEVESEAHYPLQVQVYDKDTVIFEQTYLDGDELVIKMPDDFKSWSPSSPFLYEVYVSYGEDAIGTYFGMRKFESNFVNSQKTFTLNNKPCFLSGVLDQGYNLKGGLTYVNTEMMEDDLNLLKRLGFNCLRKHLKVEPLRYYYLADKIGLIIVQDLMYGGKPINKFLLLVAPFIKFNIDDEKKAKYLGRDEKEQQTYFIKESKAIIKHLRNVTSIAIWTIFNEGWGQFNTKKVYQSLNKLDHRRLFDCNSGWFDQGVGNFNTHHVYFKKVKIKSDHRRILFLSEFGGYSLYIKEQAFSKKAFGYKKLPNEKSLQKAIDKLYMKQIVPCIQKNGLSGCIYTQLSDVEDEVNGLISFNREYLKVDEKKMREINELLYKTYQERYFEE